MKTGSFAARVYGTLYLLFPNIINFVFRLQYKASFPYSAIYFDKPVSRFKHLSISKYSSSSGVIRLISFSSMDTSIDIGRYVRIGENCWFMLNSRHTPEFVSNL